MKQTKILRVNEDVSWIGVLDKELVTFDVNSIVKSSNPNRIRVWWILPSESVLQSPGTN